MSRCYSAILGCALLWVGNFSSSAATFGDFDYEVVTTQDPVHPEAG